MNKMERVIKTLAGEQTDHAPMGFWLHFPTDVIEQGVDAQVAAHLEYKEKTQTDILKIMNENEMRTTNKIQTIDDWKKITRLTKNSKLITDQVEILNRIVTENDGECFLLGTVHGLMASLSHSSGHSYSYSPELIKEHYARNPQAIKDAMAIIEENTHLVLEATLASGVQGIYYAALGGEKNVFNDDFFADVLEKPEIGLLNATKTTEKFSFLHMCKEQVELKRYKDYPSDVVNWAMHESHYSFNEAVEIFGDKTYLGGFDDRSGVLVDGSQSEIKEKLAEIQATFGSHKYIIGADCTLPTEIAFEKIAYINELLKQK